MYDANYFCWYNGYEIQKNPTFMGFFCVYKLLIN